MKFNDDDHDDLRAVLRKRLEVAVRDRNRIAVAALREAIAALDNAEAVPFDINDKGQVGEYVAGGVVGLGAAEAERRILDPEAQRAIVRAEIQARRTAAATYEQHGQRTRSAELRSGADVLAALLDHTDGDREVECGAANSAPQ